MPTATRLGTDRTLNNYKTGGTKWECRGWRSSQNLALKASLPVLKETGLHKARIIHGMIGMV